MYMAEIGYYEEVLNGLHNLHLALHCDGFVGSIYSNWVRWVFNWVCSGSGAGCRQNEPKTGTGK